MQSVLRGGVGGHRTTHGWAAVGTVVVLLLVIVSSFGLLLAMSPANPPKGNGPSAVPPIVAPGGTVAPPKGLSPLALPSTIRPAATQSPGTIFATLSVGASPDGVAYDAQDGEVYVADTVQNAVSILNGTTVVTNITVTDPYGVVYDPADQEIYVAGYSSNIVSIISGSSVANQVRVTGGPYGLGYDPASQSVYVECYNNGNVSEISGTTLLSTGINLGAYARPVSAVYSPVNHDMYVTEFGAAKVAVVSGSTLVATIGVGKNPADAVFDLVTSSVYVPNSGSMNVTLISGTKTSGNIPLGYAVFGSAYDLENNCVYLTDNTTGQVTVLNGTKVVTVFSVGQQPFGAGFDAQNGVVYVTNSASDTVTAITTGLISGDVLVAPAGSPKNTSDTAETVTFNSTLTLNSTWTFTASINATPSVGLGCLPPPTLRVTGSVGVVSVVCKPTATGTYTLTLNVTAVGRISVLPSIVFQVFPGPTGTKPVASQGHRTGITTTDVDLTVGFNETPTGGSGTYMSFVWTGLPTPGCSSTATSHPTCQFTKSGSYTIGADFVDSNGAPGTSPTLTLFVDPLPVVTPPTASRNVADVNQPVTFATTASSGSGGYTFLWRGLPVDCTNTTATLSCAPVATGTLVVTVVAVDSNNGSSAPSSAVDVVVSPQLQVSAPIASPTQLTVGETFNVSIKVTGGPPSAAQPNVSWNGLPHGCSGLGSTTATCRTTVDGTYQIYAVVTDLNHYVVTSAKALVSVTGTPPRSGPTGGNASNTIFGLPPTTFAGLIVIVVLAVVAIVALLVLHSRGKSIPSPSSSRSRSAPAVTDEEEVTEPPLEYEDETQPPS